MRPRRDLRLAVKQSFNFISFSPKGDHSFNDLRSIDGEVQWIPIMEVFLAVQRA